MQTDTSHLALMAESMIRDAGIDNYTFDRNTLIMCGVRYMIEPCGWGEHDCNGVRLRKAEPGEGGPSLQ